MRVRRPPPSPRCVHHVPEREFMVSPVCTQGEGWGPAPTSPCVQARRMVSTGEVLGVGAQSRGGRPAGLSDGWSSCVFRDSGAPKGRAGRSNPRRGTRTSTAQPGRLNAAGDARPFTRRRRDGAGFDVLQQQSGPHHPRPRLAASGFEVLAQILSGSCVRSPQALNACALDENRSLAWRQVQCTGEITHGLIGIAQHEVAGTASIPLGHRHRHHRHRQRGREGQRRQNRADLRERQPVDGDKQEGKQESAGHGRHRAEVTNSGCRSRLQLLQRAAAPYCRTPQRGQINWRVAPWRAPTLASRPASRSALRRDGTDVNRTAQIPGSGSVWRGA